MRVDIQDKVGLVTGAGSGIGRATALRLAREGADAVVELIRDDSLAGRVMLCYEGEARRLVPVDEWL